MFTSLVILAVFLQTAIAIGVYYRRKGGQSNMWFMLLSLSLAAWALTNYIAISIPQNDVTIYAIRSVMTITVIQNTLFFLFAKTYPDRQIASFSKLAKGVLIYSVIVAVLSQTPLIFKDVTLANGTAIPNPAPFIILFIIHAVLTISLGLRSLFRQHRLAYGIHKRQLSYIITASIIVWLVVPVTNFVITLTAKTTTFVEFSPFYTLVFGAFIAYAIVAQKLFDIKAAVARSVAYVLLVATMALMYSLVLFGVVNLIFHGSERELLRQVVSVLLVFPLALSFQRIKEFFDRLTDKIFYRNSYDTQAVLNKLGKIIVAEINLQKILHGTRTVLSSTTKSLFYDFLFFKDKTPYIESPESEVKVKNIEPVVQALNKSKRTVIIADELSQGSNLKHVLMENDIAGTIRLKTQDEIVGYVLFGNKKSGDVYTSQDVKLLRIVANELAIAIQNALRFEEIQQFNITLQQKVNEATKKLRKANERLVALDQTKDDFISMASHQLRTPLTSVKGYVSMVLEGDVGKITAQQRKLLDQAFVSSQRMVYLIADLLNVSRLKTGKFIIEATPTNLADVVEGELEQLKETAAARNLELTYKKPADFPAISLDETKIRQVIMNFVDNAIYYTPSGGHIEVRLEDKGDTVEFTVSDDGIGVPKHEQHNMFNKFYRAGNAKKARPDGTGLGLFMAKKVVVAQNGSIIFRSQEGKGSTFGFSFNKKQAAISSETDNKSA